jgi:hypothetical protein
MKQLFLMAVLVGSASTVRAQTVDLDIPTAIEVDDTRLSVAFNDGITRAEAMDVVRGLDARVLDVSFRTVTVFAACDIELTGDQLSVIQALPGVIGASFHPASGRFADRAIETTSPGWTPTSLSRYNLAVSFLSTTSSETARELIDRIENVRVRSVHKVPNEIILRIDPNDETTARVLEANPSVKYAAYLVKGETP